VTEVVKNICSFMGKKCAYVAGPKQSIYQCGIFEYLKRFPEGSSRNDEKMRLVRLDSEELEKKCLEGLYYD